MRTESVEIAQRRGNPNQDVVKLIDKAEERRRPINRFVDLEIKDIQECISEICPCAIQQMHSDPAFDEQLSQERWTQLGME